MKRFLSRKIFGIVVSIISLFIVFFAQLALFDKYPAYHDVLRHLYYIPIILSAFFLGWPGGVAFAILASAGSAFHIMMKGNVVFLDIVLQTGIFCLLGTLIGLLSESERKKTRLLEKSRLDFFKALAHLLDKRDTYTEGHSHRVAHISREIGNAIGLNRDMLDNLYQAALLHDIGKIGIDDAILKKETPLTRDEYQTIQTHTVIGESVLKGIEIMEDMIPAIKYHHERFDGEGYPDKLKGDYIPFFARILSIADAFDAMTSQRVYNNRKSYADALLEIENCSGKQFDAKIVEYFRPIIEQGKLRQNVEF